MCQIPDLKAESTEAIGYFSKGNEPGLMKMRIQTLPCLCGAKTFGKVKGNTVWVECEPVRNGEK